MGKLPFHFPEVEIGFMEGFNKAIGENARVLRERYMAPDNVLKFSHGRTWEAPANALGDTKGEMNEHSTETKLNLKDIAEGKVEAVFVAVSQITADMNAQMERLLIYTMGRSTERSGQFVNGSEKTFPEAMYEALEMMELPLDEDGELSMPTMFIHPSQSSKLQAQMKTAGVEFERKFSMLKEKKKSDAQERERQRLARFERLQK